MDGRHLVLVLVAVSLASLSTAQPYYGYGYGRQPHYDYWSPYGSGDYGSTGHSNHNYGPQYGPDYGYGQSNYDYGSQYPADYDYGMPYGDGEPQHQVNHEPNYDYGSGPNYHGTSQGQPNYDYGSPHDSHGYPPELRPSAPPAPEARSAGRPESPSLPSPTSDPMPNPTAAPEPSLRGEYRGPGDTSNGAEKVGEATYYNVGGAGNDKGGYTACGETFSNQEMVAAISWRVFDRSTGNPNTSPSCKMCASVTGPAGTATVRIKDKCGGCATGDIDLSPVAFQKVVGDLGIGRQPGVRWNYVPC